MTPAIRLAEGSSDVLHDDTGRPAVEWPDGTAEYYLQGSQFSPAAYRRVINDELTLAQVAALPDADQRSVALTYLSFGRLVGQTEPHSSTTASRALGYIGCRCRTPSPETGLKATARSTTSFTCTTPATRNESSSSGSIPGLDGTATLSCARRTHSVSPLNSGCRSSRKAKVRRPTPNGSNPRAFRANRGCVCVTTESAQHDSGRLIHRRFPSRRMSSERMNASPPGMS